MPESGFNFSKREISGRLAELLGKKIEDLEIKKLGKGCLGAGYALDFKTGGKKQRKILKGMYACHLNSDYPADRAQALILAHRDYGKIPEHIKSLDVWGATRSGKIISMGNAAEFFILMDEAEGEDYFNDLKNISESGKITARDEKRIKTLARFLVGLHRKKFPKIDSEQAKSLYKRKIRDTIGCGASIMGILDMYPEKCAWIGGKEILRIVNGAAEYWARDRFLEKRLCQIHGDFHPGNIWFDKSGKFSVLDRARGEYGEAADDLAALSINFVFLSLVYFKKFAEPFKKLADIFFREYFKALSDRRMAEVSQPYFAFRAVIVANPSFYPDKFFGGKKEANFVRRKMIEFALNILNAKKVNFNKLGDYL